MRITYLGNFEPPHSTENDVRRALTGNGHVVQTVQEGDVGRMQHLVDVGMRRGDLDFILWTRTKGLADRVGDEWQWHLLAEARRAGIPVVGYHLDRWWGLDRETQIYSDPFFRVDLLCTADGGHDPEWRMLNINHAWFPPAISAANCGLGTPREEYRSDIAFVGSWQGGYHKEWRHRFELVQWLDNTYGDRVKFWPRRGEHAIRGRDLNDLYASVGVVVGDSCLVPAKDGTPVTHYCSDRIPETLGRGGMLVHPSVRGIDNLFLYQWEWSLGDFTDLRSTIDRVLDGSVWRDEGVNYSGREEYVASQVESIRTYHTYEARMQGLVAEVGLL